MKWILYNNEKLEADTCLISDGEYVSFAVHHDGSFIDINGWCYNCKCERCLTWHLRNKTVNYYIPVDSPKKPKYRSVSPLVKLRIFKRDKFTCRICGISPSISNNVELQIDHIKPWTKGGQNIEHNLQTVCRTCNYSKGNKYNEM